MEECDFVGLARSCKPLFARAHEIEILRVRVAQPDLSRGQGRRDGHPFQHAGVKALHQATRRQVPHGPLRADHYGNVCHEKADGKAHEFLGHLVNLRHTRLAGRQAHQPERGQIRQALDLSEREDTVGANESGAQWVVKTECPVAGKMKRREAPEVPEERVFGRLLARKHHALRPSGQSRHDLGFAARVEKVFRRIADGEKRPRLARLACHPFAGVADRPHTGREHDFKIIVQPASLAIFFTPRSRPREQLRAARRDDHQPFHVRAAQPFHEGLDERLPHAAADLVEKSADDAIDAIMSYVPDPDELRGPSREGLLATLRQAATENYSWSESVADTLMARGLWDAKIWGALLEAWRATQQVPASWANVLTMIDEHFEIVQAAPSGVAGLLERIADADGLSSDDLDRIERIGERVLPFSNGREPSVQRAGRTDWLTSTINHPAGHIALSWLKLLSAHMATDRSGGIPPAQRARYEALLGDQGPNGLLARVAFASHAHFLFSMDAEWTTAHVLPFFDWSINPDRAEQAWSGFLTWGDWTNDVFFDRMRPQTIQTFSHLGRLEQGGRPLSTRLAAAAVYSANDPWVGNGWLFEFVRLADADNRHEWARSFGQYLQSLSSDAAEQLWHRWVLGYCRQRGEGAPRAFDDRESDAMVEWPIGLKNVVEEVVNTFEQVGAIPSTLQYYTLYRLRESHLAESHGSVMGRYLRILLSRAQSLAHACDEVFALATDALTHGAERDDVRNIAEAMARLACPNAGQLRDKANGP